MKKILFGSVQLEDRTLEYYILIQPIYSEFAQNKLMEGYIMAKS